MIPKVYNSGWHKHIVKERSREGGSGPMHPMKSFFSAGLNLVLTAKHPRQRQRLGRTRSGRITTRRIAADDLSLQAW
jgi:hypothetical protein